eukprot:5019049-Prymnesium_polylepis.1
MRSHLLSLSEEGNEVSQEPDSWVSSEIDMEFRDGFTVLRWISSSAGGSSRLMGIELEHRRRGHQSGTVRQCGNAK